MSNSAWVTVGRVRTAYGVRGWLKVESFTEPADNLLEYSNWRLLQGGKELAVTVAEIEQRQSDILILLQGVDSREQARRFANSLIQVPKSELAELDEDDFYWHQLIGLEVLQIAQDEGEPQHIGQVESLLETGANDVLVVKASATDTVSQDAEILIPYLPGQVVREVDLQKGRVLVDWYYEY